MKIKLFTIPNLLTLCNLLSGCGAVLCALNRGDMSLAFWLIVLAAVFDFLDGFVARLLHSSSPIGKELDSLADVISFGLAPTSVLFCMYAGVGGNEWYGYLVFVLAAFSALRLAKFNIDENQTTQFIGLPTPAAALFVASAGYLFEAGLYTVRPVYVVGIAVVLSYFLVCSTPMFALKFKHYGIRGNELRYGFLLVCAAGLVFWQIAAVPFIIMLYILVSVVRRLIQR